MLQNNGNAKRFTALIIITALFIGMLSAFGAGAGTTADPLISESYIVSVFIPRIKKLTSDTYDSAVNAKINNGFSKATGKIDSLPDRILERSESMNYDTYRALVNKGYFFSSKKNEVITLNKGERAIFCVGTSFTLCGGAALLVGDALAEVIDVTDGKEAQVGFGAVLRHEYVLAGGSLTGLAATADKTTLSVSGGYQIIRAYKPSYTTIADQLSEIGIFKGSNLGYELGRSATRLEDDALAFTGTHPFKDVPFWAGDTANKYVAYGYTKGYTNGISTTLFGPYNAVTAEQFMTFVLRALGYKDNTDFVWKQALDYSVKMGMLTRAEADNSLRWGFYRDHIVCYSYYALNSIKKGTSVTILQSLVSSGDVSSAKAAEILEKIKASR